MVSSSSSFSFLSASRCVESRSVLNTLRFEGKGSGFRVEGLRFRV
jgi:hypothetical protein